MFSSTLRLWMLFWLLLPGLTMAFIFQDSTVVHDSTAAPGVGVGGFFIGYLLSEVVPLVTAWITKVYNTKFGSWYANLSNVAKMAVYVIATMLLMYLFSILGLGWDRATDATHLGPDLLRRFVEAVIATLLVKTGIKTEQTRLAKLPPEEAQLRVAQLRVDYLGDRHG
jgi:hypothetical protein